MGRRGHNLLTFLGVLVLAVVPVWIIWKINIGGNPVDSATVYGGYLAPVAIAVPLLMALLTWWWKARAAAVLSVSTAVQVAAAADRLAEVMWEVWRYEAKDRRISTPAPACVRWRWGSAHVAPPPAEVSTAPAGVGPRRPPVSEPGVLLEEGAVTHLHDEMYLRLRYGRLVLIGGPGAGKTGAMILLLLAALDYRRSLPASEASGVPVPVWLSLGGWDPSAQTLHHWAKDTIYRDHPYLRAPDYGPDVVEELLRSGHVALFLDGLDEMPPEAQLQALKRIDEQGVGLWIVLSSRPDEYAQSIAAGRLHNAAVIEVQPVAPAAAHAYLVQDQIGFQRHRWDQLGSYLEANPTSAPALALNNPLTLSLARYTYRDQDPAELTDSTRFPMVEALRRHLVDRILLTAYPDEHHRAHATRWLAWIAYHMGANRDVGWWHIPTWIPRARARLALRVGVGLMAILGVLSATLAGLLSGNLITLLLAPFIGLISGSVCGLVFVGFFGRTVRYLAEGIRNAIYPRWPRPSDIFVLLNEGAIFGLLVGLLVCYSKGLMSGIHYGLGTGAVVLAFTLGRNLRKIWGTPLSGATATPTSEYYRDRRVGAIFGIIDGTVAGLLFGLVGWLSLGLGGGLAYGLIFGLIWGLLDILKNAAPLLSLAQLVLLLTGEGRVGFIYLLEDAHARNVLRQAGAIYQFRHAELQKHLAEFHQQSEEKSGPPWPRWAPRSLYALLNQVLHLGIGRSQHARTPH